MLPDLTVTKDIAADAKLRVDMRREDFNQLAEHPSVNGWRKAIETGRREGDRDRPVPAADLQVVDKHEERSRLKRARH